MPILVIDHGVEDNAYLSIDQLDERYFYRWLGQHDNPTPCTYQLVGNTLVTFDHDIGRLRLIRKSEVSTEPRFVLCKPQTQVLLTQGPRED